MPENEKKPSLWQRIKQFAQNNPIRTALLAVLAVATIVVTGILTAGIATGALSIVGGLTLLGGVAGFAWDTANRLSKETKKTAAIENAVVTPSSTAQMAVGIGLTSETLATNKQTVVSETKLTAPIQQTSHEKDAVEEMVERFAEKYGGANDKALSKERENFAQNYLKLALPDSDKKTPASSLQKQMLSAMNNYEKAYQKNDAKEIVRAGAKLDSLYEKVEQKIDAKHRSSVAP